MTRYLLLLVVTMTCGAQTPKPKLTPKSGSDGNLVIEACCPKGWWPHVPKQKDSSTAAYVEARIHTVCSRSIPADVLSGIYTKNGEPITLATFGGKLPKGVDAPPAPLKADDSIFTMGLVTSGNILTFGDPHCGVLGTWDEGKKSCAVTVVFSPTSAPISCSPVSASEGLQRQICWYTPESVPLPPADPAKP